MYVGFPLGEVFVLKTTEIESKKRTILICDKKESKDRMLSIS